MTEQLSQPAGFEDLGLDKTVLKALADVGYETPTPIQMRTIPHVLAGKDILGQAQTGTGKTAAFALPLLSRIDLKKTEPQVLVLAPTRELAIQVAEAFHRYAAHLKKFQVLPIYGGQSYDIQLRQLKRGVHVIVGTPGRVMDHLRRGTLKLNALSCLVLDEADEMLRMGFIDDVEWILERTPGDRQIALFSATIPQAIRKISKKYLNNPEEITIKVRTTTAETIHQRYWMVNGVHKLDALTRIMEAESFDGMLVFVRTKTATAELAEKLAARGFSCAPLNGDISQSQREKTVQRLKAGKLDVLVATDVAARGLDLDRISHVVNYDIPYDPESYVHRVGRTGRAGRSGEAILFVAPRERHMLRSIEKLTKQKIEMMELPSTEVINNKRIASFMQRITDTLAQEDLSLYTGIVEQYQHEHNIPALNIAAALAKMAQGTAPLLLTEKPKIKKPAPEPRFARKGRTVSAPEIGMERFRIEVGHKDGVKPGSIVGAIANEGGIDSEFIGRINIFDTFSTVDLPEGMPREIIRSLKKIRVAGRALNFSKWDASPDFVKTRKRGPAAFPRSKNRARHARKKR